MAIILFDNSVSGKLYPLALTRAVSMIRFGLWTGVERWERVSQGEVFVHTRHWLKALYKAPKLDVHTWIDASVVVDPDLVTEILSLSEGSCIIDESGLIAGRAAISQDNFTPANPQQHFKKLVHRAPAQRIEYPWDLVRFNDAQLRYDFAIATEGRQSASIPASVTVIGEEAVFIEEGAVPSHCILNASTGPIYIGKNAEIMEGCAVRGPFAMCEGSVLKMNSRVYGATTLGVKCMGGGEIKNSILGDYSNKAHDGYLGDSAVGQWCNFGAGSSNSNLKNTAGDIKMWDFGSGGYVNAGRKGGVIMGDYSRVAINSSINTGSVIGISCNVFGAGLLPRTIPGFSWGTGETKYDLDKALKDIGNWMSLKQKKLAPEEADVLKYIFANLN